MTRDQKGPAPAGERKVRYGDETDPLIKAICPVYAHAMWGKSRSDDLSAANKRQVHQFAKKLASALRAKGLAI